MFRRHLLISVIVAAHMGVASAHETWLMPSAFSAKVDEPVRLVVTSGMGFPGLGSSIQADRLLKAGFRLRTDWKDISAPEVLEKSTVFSQSFQRDGLATVWVVLKPKDIELSDEEVVEYFAEIGASEDVRAAWARQKGRIAWKETYTKHAKTFVAVGDVREDSSWHAPIGTGTELIPETSPLLLRAGQALTVSLLSNGEPLANTPVGIMMKGLKERVFQATDANGRATLPLQQPGEALLFAVHLRLTKDGAAWHSGFTTMTVLIHPK